MHKILDLQWGQENPLEPHLGKKMKEKITVHREAQFPLPASERDQQYCSVSAHRCVCTVWCVKGFTLCGT